MWKALRKFTHLLTPRQRWQGLGIIVLMLGQALLEMAGVGLIPVYLAILVEPEKLLSFGPIAEILRIAGVTSEQLTTQALLYAGSALVVALFTLKLIYGPVVVYIRARFVQGVAQSLSNRLLRDYVYAPYSFHLNRNSSELIRNISGECVSFGANVLKPLLGVIGNALITVAIAALVVVSAPGVGLVALLVFGIVIVAVIKGFGSRIRRSAREAQAARGRVLLITQEVLAGIKELKLLGRERNFLDRFRVSLRKVLEVLRLVEVAGKIQPLLLEWVVVVTLLSLIMLLVLRGESTGTLVATAALFALASARLKASTGQLMNDYAQLRVGTVTVDLLTKEFSLVERLPNDSKVSEDSAHATPLAFERTVRVEDVYFRYLGAEDYALRGVNLEIRRGEAVGLVGPSGSGKSTLVDLILGLYEPERGKVRIDGVDLQTSLPAWHRTLGYIPQSLFLTDGTIRQNIGLGLLADEIDDDAIERAVEAASLTDVIKDLPRGLDTLVGERGVRLSGGQRQRIVIARALYHDPQVLVMDEATSALDTVTERAVMDAVNKLRKHRTIIIVAHRISTVRNLDRIVFLRNGEIEAAGSYDELMAGHVGFRKLAGAH